MCLSLVKYLLRDIQIDVLVHIHGEQLFRVVAKIHKLLDPVGAKMRRHVPQVLAHDLGLCLFAPQSVTKRRFDDHLVQHGPVVQRHGQSIADRPLVRIVIVPRELLVLDALNLLPQALDERALRRLAAVRVIRRLEAVEDEHCRDHVLHAVVPVGEIVHLLELFVDDADARLVGPVGHALDVGRRLAHGAELDVDAFGRFDRRLGVKFGWEEEVSGSRRGG